MKPVSLQSLSLALACWRAMGNANSPTLDSFGPLWRDPSFVASCLTRYAKSEGHDLTGRTVGQIAYVFPYDDPYGASGEELSALVCLLLLGEADRVL